MECIQYCQRSSHLALSRCCKTENVQGTLSHTPNGWRAGKDKFEQSFHTKLAIWKQMTGWTAVVKSRVHTAESTEPSRGVSGTKHTTGTGIHYAVLHQTILVLNQGCSATRPSFSHTCACQEASSEEHVSIKFNHKRQ